MYRIKTYMLMVFLCVISQAQAIRGSSIIFVNLCKDESLVIVKVKDKKELKDQRYQLYSTSEAKQKKEKLLRQAQDERMQRKYKKHGKKRVVLKYGVMGLDVDSKKGEDIWAKGKSWNRFKGTKLHYRDFELKKLTKNGGGNYIVFIENSKKALSYGGSFKFYSEKFFGKKEDFIKKITKIYNEIIPRVKEINDLSIENIDTSDILTKYCDEVEDYAKMLQSLGKVKDYYSDLVKGISSLNNRLLGYYSHEKFEIEKVIEKISSSSVKNKKSKNKKIEKHNKHNGSNKKKRFVVKTQENKKIKKVKPKIIRIKEIYENDTGAQKLRKSLENIGAQKVDDKFVHLDPKDVEQVLGKNEIPKEKKIPKNLELIKKLKKNQENLRLSFKSLLDNFKDDKNQIGQAVVDKIIEDIKTQNNENVEDVYWDEITREIEKQDDSQKSKKKKKFVCKIKKQDIDYIIKNGDHTGVSAIITCYIVNKNFLNLETFAKKYDITVLQKFVTVAREKLNSIAKPKLKKNKKNSQKTRLLAMMRNFNFAIARKKAQEKAKRGKKKYK
ncbi:hypothetical protein ACFLYU_03060 [Candidatus Dependentiae bacterium]